MALYGAVGKQYFETRAVTTQEASDNFITVDLGVVEEDCIFVFCEKRTSTGGVSQIPTSVAWTGATSLVTFTWAAITAGDIVTYAVVGK